MQHQSTLLSELPFTQLSPLHSRRELSVYLSSQQSAWKSILLKLLQNFWLLPWVVLPKAFFTLALDTVSEYRRHSQYWEPLLIAGMDLRGWFAPTFGILMKCMYNQQTKSSFCASLPENMEFAALNRLEQGPCYMWWPIRHWQMQFIRLFTRNWRDTSLKKQAWGATDFHSIKNFTWSKWIHYAYFGRKCLAGLFFSLLIVVQKWSNNNRLCTAASGLRQGTLSQSISVSEGSKQGGK